MKLIRTVLGLPFELLGILILVCGAVISGTSMATLTQIMLRSMIKQLPAEEQEDARSVPIGTFIDLK